MVYIEGERGMCCTHVCGRRGILQIQSASGNSKRLEGVRTARFSVLLSANVYSLSITCEHDATAGISR